MNSLVKKISFLVAILGILFTMNYILFMEHWKDSAPTPVPKSYIPVAIGSQIDIGDEFQATPVFFHFTSPYCKCSSTVKMKAINLIKNHIDRIQFVIVLETEKEEDFQKEKKEWQNLLGNLKDLIPIRDDREGELAKKLGIFSTPQVAILDPNHKLFYKGNYFNARYDIKNKKNMAEEALIGFFSNKDYTEFAKNRKAIGCVLPSLEKEGKK